MPKMADVECPVCGKLCKPSQINTHVNACLTASENREKPKRGNSDNEEKEKTDCQPAKRLRTCEGEKCERPRSQSNGNEPQKGGKSDVIKAWSFMKSPKSGQNCQKTKNTNEDSSSAVPVVAQACGPANAINEGKKDSEITENHTASVSSSGTHSRSRTSYVNSSGAESNPTIGTNANGVGRVLFKSNSNEGNASNGQNASITLGSQKWDGIPLPERMRPKTFKDYMGQEKVMGKNKLLRTLLESDKIPNMILWGPPGCGKTTLAKIIAARCKETHNTKFVTLSATTAGVSDVKEIVKIAKNDLKMLHRRTILFIDEIHRFNKLQQDTFLPHVEDGTISLIGATTENPSFQVNNALMSRCKVIILEKLGVEDIKRILQKAIDHLGVTVVKKKEDTILNNNSIGGIEEESLLMLANLCDGDARAALNCLQIAVDSCLLSTNSNTHVITVEHIKETLQRSHVQYDRSGEEHYNCASALQKSIRGSSDNGAIYWLSRMLEGGEDPLFIARRLVVTASEDIGMADPQALPLAIATFEACRMIGMPECAINLAHCTTYLARAPKSCESNLALIAARNMIHNHEGPLPGVPLHLRNAPTKLLKNMGCGKNYRPRDSSQTYLPEELLNVNFFKKS